MADRATILPVVGVGASAGGVEALSHLFNHMPADTGCGFVVVTHLAPDRRSMLPEIVARYTSMPVHEAAEGTVVGANQVYVLPGDAILGIENRVLTIRKPASGKRERKIIDIFFSALAKDAGEQAAAIVLSGGDGDGTLGAKAIKERDGFTLAQTTDGTEPQYSDMPQSAIASGVIDLAVPVQEMGRHIASFARGFRTPGQAEAPAPGPDGVAEARSEICAILRNQTGHDFSGYKEKIFFRRVQRRLLVNRLDSAESYLARLRADPKEVMALFRDLLINVTNFFRDAEAFEVLEKLAIPQLFAGRGAADAVRVWVPGCATGEEVYSIAILLREQMDTLTAIPKVQIFATDIDEPALSVARAARYPEALMDSVSPERRRRFFIQEDGSYLVAKDVRDMCVFSPHSVIRDPPFSRIDLVSCRNLLIYFGPEIQNQVIPTFRYALKPGGFLFLGTSDNVGQFAELFTPLDKKNRLFRTRAELRSTARLPRSVSGIRPALFAPTRPAGKEPGGIALRHSVEAHMLERYTPAHVVVNRDGDVVYYSSRTGKYLEPMAGTPSRQLLTMARKGLRLDLRAVLREAAETGQRVVRENVAVDADGDRVQIIDLAAEPLPDSAGDDRLFVIVFRDIGQAASREEVAMRATAPDEAAIQLERELRETRERLQSLIEEYETALEELKSSNEELISVNEELQSTNEELEASREELQSVNEELHTVNTELSGKVDALDRAQADLTNLFESTKVATVFLDRDLVIRSYTPAVTQFFNILPGDRGRPLTDLSARINLSTLSQDVRTVLASGELIERTITPEGSASHYLLRLAPYRDVSHKVDGVVLGFLDVTSLTRAEAHHKVLIAELNNRVKNMLSMAIGVAEQTYRSARDPAAFQERFMGRLRAMDHSYALLSRENWGATPLEDLVKLHLGPAGLERAQLHSRDIRVSATQALSLGMILHELVTNAVKYGALGDPDGQVIIKCELAGKDVVLTWKECGGPQAGKPKPPGFGLKLVMQEVSQSLHGKADVNFSPDGLEVTICFPREADDDGRR